MKKIPQTFITHIDDVKVVGFTKAAILGKIRFNCQLNFMQKQEYISELSVDDLTKLIGGTWDEICDAIIELLEENYLKNIGKNLSINHDLLPYYEYELSKSNEKFKYHFFEDNCFTLRRGKYKGYNLAEVSPQYNIWLLENVMLLSKEERKTIIQHLVLHFGHGDTSQWEGVSIKDGTSKEINKYFPTK